MTDPLPWTGSNANDLAARLATWQPVNTADVAHLLAAISEAPQDHDQSSLWQAGDHDHHRVKQQVEVAFRSGLRPAWEVASM